MAEDRGEYLIEDAVTHELLRYMTIAQLRELAEHMRDIQLGTGYGKVSLHVCGDDLFFETTSRHKAGRLPKVSLE